MNDFEIVKVVNKDKCYKDSKGKERLSINYYVVVNNTYIAIRPSFSKGYSQLDLVAKTIINGGSNEHAK